MRKFTVLIFAWNKSPSRKKCLLFTVKHVFTSNHCFTAIYLSSMPIAFLKPWHITQLFSELIQKRNDFSSVLTHKRCENTWHIEYVRERLWRNSYWLNSTTKRRENWQSTSLLPLRFVSVSLSVLLSWVRLDWKDPKLFGLTAHGRTI